jgi:regulator of sigma E protease
LIITLLVFAASIMVLVGVHEAGHFFAARAFGVYIHEFAIGFGPKLFSVQGKETRYSLRLIPFGGYVRMAGEDQVETDVDIPSHRVLYNKPPVARALITLAGPCANLLLAFLVIVIVIWSIPFPILQVSGVVPDAPAATALRFEDKVLSIDGRKVLTLDDITTTIQRSQGAPVEFRIVRDGSTMTVPVTPEYVENESRYIVGAYFLDAAYTTRLETVSSTSTLGKNGLKPGDTIVAIDQHASDGTLGSLLTALEDASGQSQFTLTYSRDGTQQTITLPMDANALTVLSDGVIFSHDTVETRPAGFERGVALASGRFVGYIVALADVVRGVVVGQVAAGDVFEGPVGVAELLGQSVRIGASFFFQLLAFLSLNFGLINLVPFPALDGSRVVFAVYEWIRGKPIPPQREGIIHAIGFVILIGLMILITYRDIVRLFQ